MKKNYQIKNKKFNSNQHSQTNKCLITRLILIEWCFVEPNVPTDSVTGFVLLKLESLTDRS